MEKPVNCTSFPVNRILFLTCVSYHCTEKDSRVADENSS